MKRITLYLMAGYLLICGFTLSTTDKPAADDVLLFIELDVKSAGGVIKPNLDKNFDRMVLSKTISYNNSNPHNATRCTMEVRIPAKYQTEFLEILNKSYKNCTIVSTKIVPVPTPTRVGG